MLYKHANSWKATILIVYADDMTITGNDVGEIEWLKLKLSAEFFIKSMGALKYFLGIELVHPKEGTFCLNINM